MLRSFCFVIFFIAFHKIGGIIIKPRDEIVSVPGVIRGLISRQFERATVRYSWTDDKGGVHTTTTPLQTYGSSEEYSFNNLNDMNVLVVLDSGKPVGLKTIDDAVIANVGFEAAPTEQTTSTRSSVSGQKSQNQQYLEK